MQNWAPGSSRIAYSEWAPAAYVEDGTGWKEFSLRGEDDDAWMPMTELWINKAETRVLAADELRVRLWSMDGSERWTWEPERARDRVHSVHFDPDDETVWVGAGLSIYHIDATGSARKVLTARRPRIPGKSKTAAGNNGAKRKAGKPLFMPRIHADPRTDAFVDDVVPLGNGRVAYMVVALHARPLGFEESERLLEQGKVDFAREPWF